MTIDLVGCAVDNDRARLATQDTGYGIVSRTKWIGPIIGGSFNTYSLASNEQDQFRLGVPAGDFNGDTLYTFRSNSAASSHSEDHEEQPLLQEPPSSPPVAEEPTISSPPSPPLVILTLTSSLSRLEIPDDVDSVQALTPRSGQTDRTVSTRPLKKPQKSSPPIHMPSSTSANR